MSPKDIANLKAKFSSAPRRDIYGGVMNMAGIDIVEDIEAPCGCFGTRTSDGHIRWKSFSPHDPLFGAAFGPVYSSAPIYDEVCEYLCTDPLHDVAMRGSFYQFMADTRLALSVMDPRIGVLAR
jgi:hypothetical protein